MLVVRASEGLAVGDTVRVDLTHVSEDGRVAYSRGGRSAGTLPLGALGPSGDGHMVVTADRLNVRRCRSTGCSVEGYVARGQMVEVRDFAGRWYRVIMEDVPVGYLNVEHLQLPLVQQRGLLAAIRQLTAEFYDGELKSMKVGGAAVFSGYDVKLDDELLNFAFFTPFQEGPILSTICDAMRGIAGFVRTTMSENPTQLFPAYSAGVYYQSADIPTQGELMVAGLTGEEGVYCANPN
jgi:hypothetical protein